MLPGITLSPEHFYFPAVLASFFPIHIILFSSPNLILTKLEKMKISLKDISVHQEIKLKGKTENGVAFISVWKSSLTFTIRVQF